MNYREEFFHGILNSLKYAKAHVKKKFLKFIAGIHSFSFSALHRLGSYADFTLT